MVSKTRHVYKEWLNQEVHGTTNELKEEGPGGEIVKPIHIHLSYFPIMCKST